MKVLKYILSIVLAFNLLSTTLEQEDFINDVHINYDYYAELINDDLSIGHFNVFVGLYQEKFSISIFFYQQHNNQHQINIIEQGSMTKYKISTRSYYNYRIPINSSNINLQIVEKSQGNIYKEYKLELPTSKIDFKKNALLGDGRGAFPKNPLQISTSSIAFLTLMGFLGLSLVFALIILFVFKNKRGVFNPDIQSLRRNALQVELKHLTNVSLEEENLGEDGKAIYEQADFAEPDFNYHEDGTKEEQMAALFKAYHEGKITESDLNAALRMLWWENDQDNDE